MPDSTPKTPVPTSGAGDGTSAAAKSAAPAAGAVTSAASAAPATKSSTLAASEKYTSDDLEHLSDLQHVRERPSMYIGDTTVRGLHHLVYEVVDNSIDEAMAGICQAMCA